MPWSATPTAPRSTGRNRLRSPRAGGPPPWRETARTGPHERSPCSSPPARPRGGWLAPPRCAGLVRGHAVPGRQAGEPLRADDHPDALVADGGALGGQGVRDLLDGAVEGTKLEHPLPQAQDLAGPLGAGLGGSEERDPPRPQIADTLVHRRLRVAEANPGLLCGGPVDLVGPQRLVATLGGVGWLGEEPGSRPHTSVHLPEQHSVSVAPYSPGPPDFWTNILVITAM